MGESKEIVTLQLGHYSNFVGTHFWNLQESSFVFDASLASKVEVDHDILFRQGCTRSGDPTYTPRLISFDLKGSLGSFSHLKSTEEQISQELPWDGSVEFHRTEAASKNAFLQSLEEEDGQISNPIKMEEEVQVWSDFLRPKLHHRSIYLLQDYYHLNPVEPFDVFPLGTSFWAKEERQDEVEDLIRTYVEECDHLQGFQIFVDADNGFSGLGDSILQHLNDEYGAKTSLVFPVLPPLSGCNQHEKMERLINCGLSMQSLMEFSSFFSPVSIDCNWTSVQNRIFKHINYQPSLPYHSSAVIATALDTTTMVLRRKNGPTMTLTDLEHSLVRGGRKAVGISTVLPLLATSDQITDALATQLVSLTPCIDRFQPVWTQSFVWRGVTDPTSLQTVVDQWSQKRWDCTVTANTLLRQPCPAGLPYPQFFSEDIAPQPRGLGSFATVSGLHSSPLLGSQCLQQLNEIISRINVKKLHRFLSLGSEEDDLLANRDALSDYVRSYRDDLDMSEM